MGTIKKRLYEIIFNADSRAGKIFDVTLILLISLSVVIVFLESVPSFRAGYHHIFIVIEWIVTILFLIEYVMRTLVIDKPIKYIFSFYGIIDILSILPAFVELFIIGGHNLVVIRVLRLLRIFRVLKLVRFVYEGNLLYKALVASRVKVGVFLFTVLNAVIVLGTIMYLIEGEHNGFTSIPKSIYWAIVTLTTVGYGDIAPQTPVGQFVSSIIMIIGYAIIAVPTGIVTVEMNKVFNEKSSAITCPKCFKEMNDNDAEYCKYCGEKLHGSD